MGATTLSVAACATQTYEFDETSEQGAFSRPPAENTWDHSELADSYLYNYQPQHSLDEWVCSWDPTINDDWHDDVLCSDGSHEDRPYLLPSWTFVSRDDLMAEALWYQDYLNGR